MFSNRRSVSKRRYKFFSLTRRIWYLCLRRLLQNSCELSLASGFTNFQSIHAKEIFISFLFGYSSGFIAFGTCWEHYGATVNPRRIFDSMRFLD